jgi:uncharacterized membrane protein
MIQGVLEAIHVLGAVVWVGGMAFALLVLRPSLAVLEPPQRMALHLQVFRRFFLIIWHAMPLVLLTGYALVFFRYGDFAEAGPGVGVMHMLGLIMTVVFVGIFFRPWKKLRAGDRAALDAIRKLITLNLVLGLVTIAIAAYHWR